MAFLHCHNCHWGQDDFWNENYNPIRFLLYLEKDLLIKPMDEVAIHATDTRTCYGANEGDVSRREMIARSCERAADHIRKMAWRTHEEYKTDKNRCCPRCGHALDID